MKPQLVYALCISVSSAAYADTLPDAPAVETSMTQAIQTNTGWVIVRGLEKSSNSVMFRRYSYADNRFPNLIIFNCAIGSTMTLSNLTFIVPKNLQIKSFPRESWFLKFEFRVLINDVSSVSADGEYNKGEIYVDLTPSFKDNFTKLMTADSIQIGFGGSNDEIKFIMTNKVNKVLVDPKVIKMFPSLGRFRFFSNADVFDACKKYGQSHK
jgi:hypothetical protein